MEIKPTKMTSKILTTIINKKPNAYSLIQGENGIHGTVCFYAYQKGTVMIYEITNLPRYSVCEGGVFGFHIHEGQTCINNTQNSYEKTKGHENPQKCQHPYHLGDLPPLFALEGTAWSVLYIDKFQIKDIIGKTIVVHEHADDFYLQPAGNPGTKIACGEIKKFFKNV